MNKNNQNSISSPPAKVSADCPCLVFSFLSGESIVRLTLTIIETAQRHMKLKKTLTIQFHLAVENKKKCVKKLLFCLSGNEQNERFPEKDRFSELRVSNFFIKVLLQHSSSFEKPISVLQKRVRFKLKNIHIYKIRHTRTNSETHLGIYLFLELTKIFW